MSRRPLLNQTRFESLSSTRPNGVEITVTHKYIAAPLGNGRILTANRSGGSVKGEVPKHVADAWFAMIDDQTGYRLVNKIELVRRINAFIDGLDTMWAAWNAAPDTTKFQPGYRGVMDLGITRGPRKGERIYTLKARPTGRGVDFTVCFEGDTYDTHMNGDYLVKYTVRDV